MFIINVLAIVANFVQLYIHQCTQFHEFELQGWLRHQFVLVPHEEISSQDWGMCGRNNSRGTIAVFHGASISF